MNFNLWRWRCACVGTDNWVILLRARYKYNNTLTLILLTWRIWWAPNNASKWQMGFNSAFKGLNDVMKLSFLKALKAISVTWKLDRLENDLRSSSEMGKPTRKIHVMFRSIFVGTRQEWSQQWHEYGWSRNFEIPNVEMDEHRDYPLVIYVQRAGITQSV